MKKSVAISIVVAASILLSGCAASQISNTPQQPSQPQLSTKTQTETNVAAVERSLPPKLQEKLSNPKSRLRSGVQLPASIHNKSAKNVLYINPMEQYAIAQFRLVWGKLPSTPDVVWTGTTEATAKSLWLKEGYQGDPLPSNKTLYITKSLATPDAYHRVGKLWQEEPGITSEKDVSFWVTFFTRS